MGSGAQRATGGVPGRATAFWNGSDRGGVDLLGGQETRMVPLRPMVPVQAKAHPNCCSQPLHGVPRLVAFCPPVGRGFFFSLFLLTLGHHSVGGIIC